MQTDTTRENPQGSVPQAADSNLDLSATAPGQLRVIKRNGTVVPYTDDKITVAITKAFLAVEGGTAAASSRIHDTVARLTEQVTATFKRRMPSGGTIHIEEIQDQVELALMRAGEQKVARDYVIYRDARSKERAVRSPAEESAVQAHPSIRITLADGSFAPLDLGRLNTIITEACEGLEEVDGDLIQRETLKNLYDGVALTDVNTALVMTARTLVEREPNYSFVTARLLMDTLRAEGLGFLGVADSATHHEMADLYAKALPAYIAKGIEFELLNPILATFDLENSARRSTTSATSSSPTWACKPCTTVTSSTRTGSASNCRKCSSCVWPWAWRLKRSKKKTARLSSTTCCRPSTTCRRPQPCSTPAPCVHSCRAAT